MTFNANNHNANDLAAQLSAFQDGYTDNSSFEALFSGTGEVGGLDVARGGFRGGPSLDALANFDVGMTDWDAVEQACDIGSSLLSDNPIQQAVDSNAGAPWPTLYEAPDYFTEQGQIPSQDLVDDSALSNMEFCAEAMRAGVSGFGDASLSALRSLGDLAVAQPSNPRVKDFRRVMGSAILAGTPVAAKTAQALILKANKLAALADERAKVTVDAQRGFVSALRETQRHDLGALRAARQMLDAEGNFKPGATEMDVLRLKRMRERAFEAGRRAIRYQKVHTLGTVLTRNAIAQADLLQKTAASVLGGNTGATAALSEMYDEIGKQSQQIKNIRRRQISNWQKDAETGLGTADPYESELNGIEAAWLEGLEGRSGGGLEGLSGFGELGRCRSVCKRLRKAARKAKKAAKPFVKVIKETAKIAVAPVKATFRAGKSLSKGDFKGAFKAVGQSVINSAKSMKKIVGFVLVDVPCLLASSKIGAAATEYAGQAVGTVVGGIYTQPQLGGAVGKEAGKQAANTNKAMCGAAKQIGLNDGKFRPGQIKGAFKTFGKKMYRQTFSPKAQFGSIKRIGMNYAAGGMGGAGSDMSNYGGEAIAKLGLKKLEDKAKDVAHKQTQKYVRKAHRRVFGKRAESIMHQGAQLYASQVQGKNIDTKALMRTAQQQGGQFARQQLQQRAKQELQRRAQQAQQALQQRAQRELQYRAQMAQQGVQQRIQQEVQRRVQAQLQQRARSLVPQQAQAAAQTANQISFQARSIFS